MNIQEIRGYYSREDVQEFLLEISKDREVVGVFRDGGFSTRPGVLIYPGDIQALLKSGVVAFHGSIERWSKPMALKQDNYDSLRKGFDLILDIDCEAFEHGKIAAKVFLLGLEKHGISNHYLKFSVDYNEPVIIRNDNETKIVPIGKLVDDILNKSDHKIFTPQNNGEEARINSKVEACVFDTKTLKTKFAPITKVYRHEITEPLYELILKSGRKVRVTGSHSIFILKNGKIYSQAVSKIKKGDYLIIPKNLPTLSEKREINLIKELGKLPDKEIKGIFVTNITNKINLSMASQKERNRWKNIDSVPLSYLKKTKQLNIDIKILKTAQIHSHSHIKFPIIIPVTDKLLRLLGYYVAEGCSLTKGTYSIILSFGAHETEIITDAKDCINSIFGLSCREHKAHPSSVQVLFGGRLSTIIFERVFKCGKNAKNKRVPPIVFNVNKEKKLEFLKGYYADGYTHKNEIIFKTVSKDLASDIAYIFLQLGIVSRIKKELYPSHWIAERNEVKSSLAYLVKVSKPHINGNSVNIHPPVAIPTNHSGVRALYKLMGPKRNPHIRSKIFCQKHIGPQQLGVVLNYMKKYSKPDFGLKILEALKNGPNTTTDIKKYIPVSDKVVYRCINKLETNGLIKKIRNCKAIGAGGLPSIWGITNKGKYILKENAVIKNSIKQKFDFFRRLINGNLGFDSIIEINKVQPSERFVYDISVYGYENFVGGFGGVMLHNTGGKGFHIGIPWEAIPNTINYKATVKLFPDLARNIGLYIREFLREKLERELLKRYSPEELAEQVGKPLGEVMSKDILDPYKVVDIDPVMISPRHLFRLPYSLHEKTFLVSVPIKLGQLDEFKREDAEPGKVRVLNKFLDTAEENEAEALVTETMDWVSRIKAEEKKGLKERPRLGKAIPPNFFPPCIENIRNGLSDGRKRSVFVLINFLKNLNWKWEDIERILEEWNEKNQPPLRENYLRTHIRWHMNRDKAILPPNCAKQGYYQDMGVCKPDGTCGWDKKTIKNPVNYPFRKMQAMKGKIKGR